ncbi:MAG: family 16 glycoside hydrolase, partial [Ktedonobacteraceae bacterium]
PTTPTYYYQANWSQGPGDWSLASHWSWSNADGGMLMTDGRENNSWIFPSTQLPSADYTLQVKIRRLSYTNVGGPSFGAIVRYTSSTGGYVGGVGIAIQPEHYFLALGLGHNGQPAIAHDLTRKSMTVDQQWHSYRIDVQGKHITLSVDGSVVTSVTDSTYTSAGQIGLYASAAVIDVEDFVVLPLPATHA